MRNISEQELKDILDKHGKWLRGAEGGERADLRSANLRSADFRSANLRAADLSSADLSYADFRSADLRSANLSYADLSYANLSSADLSYADLGYADLGYADLRYANLSYANLSSADLVLFQFQRQQAFFTLDGTLRIGCYVMPISEWALGFEEIGKANGYSEAQIKSYGKFIQTCLEMFKDSTK